MKSFKDYLVEETKLVTFAFGRFNPPSIGHEKVFDAVKKLSRGGVYRIYASKTNDKKKNPLIFKDKIKFMRKMFPKHARNIMADADVRTVFDIAVKLYDQGFTKVQMVVGSDRVREFDTLLNKYNGVKGRHGFYEFEGTINVLSAGERDPDDENAAGMSASKLRQYALDGDRKQFAFGIGTDVASLANDLYNAVRKGMGLKEQTEFKNHVQLETTQAREQFVAGKFQVGEQVIIKETDIVATIVRRGSNYLIVESNGQIMRKWIDAVEAINEYKYDFGTPEATKFAKKMTPGYEARQDPDIDDRKGSQPAAYFKGIKSKATKAKRDAQFKKQAKMSDDDPAAYKPAPGDARAKTKPSKHTKKFKQMFGDD